MPVAEETKPERKKADPKGLSPEYHKAHKQLMLWATILFIWEFVGVNLDKAKEAGGNIGPIVAAIKSPQAVPWVLLILILYFLFKCWVEWAQCHADRRRILFARIDYIAALTVSGAAIALYVGQTISRVQFADFLQGSDRILSMITGITTGASVGVGSALLMKWYQSRRKPPWRYVALIAGLLVFEILYVIQFRLVLSLTFLSIGVLIGLLLSVPMFHLLSRTKEE